MTGAMYAAIAGLKSHMNKLNVIGNNTANVNTYGYKAGRATFQESLYTSIRSGTDGTAQIGGNNPAQIGYGCNMGAINVDMSTGTLVPTGYNLDCMIDGGGFFLVGGKPTVGADGEMGHVDPNSLYLSKVGEFSFDSDGYLVDNYNNVVYGFVPRTGAAGAESEPGALADVNKPEISTQLVPIRLPLQAKRPENDTDPVEGSAIYPGVDADGRNVYDQGGDADSVSNGKTIGCQMDSISISKTGVITGSNDADGSRVVIGYLAMGSVPNPSGLTHINGSYYQAQEGAGDVAVNSFGDVLNGKYLDNVQGADIDDDNPGIPIYGSGSELLSGFLEGSGTDVATEFTEMITTQRGYQANTRIITVTDAMLEELVNIKR